MEREHRHRKLLSQPYMTLGESWAEYVNTPMKQGELHDIRNCVNRQAPLSSELWQMETTTQYGMLSTLNQRGRFKVAYHYFPKWQRLNMPIIDTPPRE